MRFLMLLNHEHVRQVILTRHVNNQTRKLRRFARRRQLRFLHGLTRVTITILITSLRLVRTVRIQVEAQVTVTSHPTLTRIRNYYPRVAVESTYGTPTYFETSEVTVGSPNTTPA